jgi:nitrite reductase/ring-hydroxylating ferredoxin subunit
MATFQRVAAVTDLAPGKCMAVHVGGQKIALFNAGGTFYAIGDTCTHRGGPLSEGTIQGTTVICPWHGACFELSSGKNLTPPAPGPVPAYRVRVEGTDVQVEIP